MKERGEGSLFAATWGGGIQFPLTWGLVEHTVPLGRRDAFVRVFLQTFLPQLLNQHLNNQIICWDSCLAFWADMKVEDSDLIAAVPT